MFDRTFYVRDWASEEPICMCFCKKPRFSIPSSKQHKSLSGITRQQFHSISLTTQGSDGLHEKQSMLNLAGNGLKLLSDVMIAFKNVSGGTKNPHMRWRGPLAFRSALALFMDR
jgi:hypothetical protein